MKLKTLIALGLHLLLLSKAEFGNELNDNLKKLYKEYLTEAPTTTFDPLEVKDGKASSTIKELAAKLELVTMRILDESDVHVCTGIIVSVSRLLTSCRCVHVYDPETGHYALYDRQLHKRYIGYDLKLKTPDVGKLCPKHVKAEVTTAFPAPDCIQLANGYFLHDVGVFVTNQIVIGLGDTLDFSISPEDWDKTFARHSKGNDLRLYYESWESFYAGRTFESIKIVDKKQCMAMFKERHLTFPKRLETEEVYCSSGEPLSLHHQPCFGREGASMFFYDSNTPSFILSHAGNCSYGRIPALFYSLKHYYEFIRGDGDVAMGYRKRANNLASSENLKARHHEYNHGLSFSQSSILGPNSCTILNSVLVIVAWCRH